jgi:hypothetical protein
LLVAFYKCGKWSSTLREKRRLSAFDNSVPRKMFGPKKEEAKGDWKKIL